MIEYMRKVSYVVLTEEGVFHAGQVPGDYDGPQVPVELCHRIVFTDINGNLITQSYNNPKPMDASRTPVDFKVADMEVLEAVVSEVAEDGGNYKHYFPQAVKDRADKMKELLEQQGSLVI